MQNVTSNGRNAKDHFELAIRLQQSRGSHPSDAALRLRAQALVKDILMSRLEVDAEINAQEYVHTQGFDDLGRALAASRALQVAFEGFRAVVPAPRTNLSVVLDSSTPDSVQASLSVEQKDLLDSAKPSQVLITQAFYDRIAHYQPALRSSPLRAGVYEFLWTSEQRLDELEAEAALTPTLIQPTLAAETVAETVITPAVKPAPAPRWKEPEQTSAPRPEPVDHVPARRLSSAKIFAIGGAVAILMIVGFLVNSYVLGNPSKPVVETTRQGKPSPIPPTQGTPRAAPPSTNIGTGSPTGTAQAQKPTTPPLVKPPKPAGIPSDNAASSQPPSPKPARRNGCTIDGEIPNYLSLAEGNRSRGKFDRAISEYNLVLACEPGNHQAQAGLRNAEEAEKYSH